MHLLINLYPKIIAFIENHDILFYEGDYMDKQEWMNQLFFKLSQSTFRSQFHLSDKDKIYIQEKGMDTIEEHARDFVRKRLAPAVIENDGKQTPMRGHPVFVAQHATATCCRGCLSKWHTISKHGCLSEKQQDYIVMIIMQWIMKEMQKNICR